MTKNFPVAVRSEFRISILVAALSGAHCYGVGARTVWPGVSIPLLNEKGSLICSFCFSVGAREIVCWSSPICSFCFSVGAREIVCWSSPSYTVPFARTLGNHETRNNESRYF